MTRGRWAVLMAAAALPCAGGGCDRGGASDGKNPSEVTSVKAPRSLKTGPISYFNDQCARCHGDDGSFAGVAFVAAPASDAELVRAVEEMVEGPAEDRVEGAELGALIAFHRTLVLDEPFVAVTKIDPDEVTGEVSPGARVRVRFGESDVEAPVDEQTWLAAAPKGFDARARREEVSVEASAEGAHVRIALGEEIHSHNQPLQGDENKDQGSGVSQ